MRQGRGQTDQPGCLIDRGGLYGCDLVPAKRLAHKVKPAGQGGVAKAAVTFAWEWRADSRFQRLFRIGDLGSAWAFARAPAIAPIVSLERCIAGLHLKKIKTNCAGFRAPGAHAVPDGFPGIVWHQ